MKKVKIRIQKSRLDLFASGSLYDLVAISASEGDEVVLSFEQSTMEWKRKNGGPDVIVITEHVIPCMMEDLLMLSKRFDVSITMETGDDFNQKDAK